MNAIAIESSSSPDVELAVREPKATRTFRGLVTLGPAGDDVQARHRERSPSKFDG